MASIKEYTTGSAGKAVRNAYDLMQTLNAPLPETPYAELFEKALIDQVPLKLDRKQVAQRIQKADKCAMGERICRCEFPESPVTYSIFLDELAEAMVNAEKAEYLAPDKALETLLKDKECPLIMSKVSGKYMEICMTYPRHCFYWNSEKHGMKCFKLC